LRQALERYWNDDHERARAGAAGLAYVRQHLSWDKIAKQLAEHYAGMARDRKGR
jgi:glycosyltransferase involved in cell wall biosynthesis